jgi:DNA mismatch endonuclease (patch repair protein)
VPQSNRDYWLPKLRRNVDRDKKHEAALKESGWDVFVIWECEIREGHDIETKIREYLEG